MAEQETELLRMGAWPGKQAVMDHVPADLLPLLEWIDLEAAPEMTNTCMGVLLAPSPALSSAASLVPSPVPADKPQWPARIPVLDASALQDPEERDRFFERALARAALERVFVPGWKIPHLVAFNIRERYRVLVHDPKQHRLMGRLIAKAKDHPREALEESITEHYLGAVAKPVTPRKHASLFAHVLELLGDRMDARARDEIDAAVAEFVAGRVFLLVPLDRLAAEIATLHVAGLQAQSYFHPSALERALRFGDRGRAPRV